MPHNLSRYVTTAALAALALTASSAAPARERLQGEALVDKLVAGRVAGAPVDCIQLYNVRSTTVVDRTAILYDTGSVIYVNRPRGGAESLDDDDILVTELHSSQLCSIDVVHLQERTSFMMTGFVSLGDFVPYRKVRAPG